MIAGPDSGRPQTASTRHPRRSRFAVELAAKLLLIIGIALLSWCAIVEFGARSSQQAANRYLEQERAGLRRVSGSGAISSTPGAMMGRIDIPRVGVSSIYFEGTDADTLERGPGHIEDTALPGGSGNVGIAGHRDTVFRGLKDIQADDVIVLTTPTNVYSYRVDSTKIVDPGAVDVLNDFGHPMLTLVTCYPFYYVGSAPQRFIVWAHQVPQS